jgi:hypothetical protein
MNAVLAIIAIALTAVLVHRYRAARAAEVLATNYHAALRGDLSKPISVDEFYSFRWKLYNTKDLLAELDKTPRRIQDERE